ncbi:MAG: hypothetical protein KME50_35065 [Nostoc desertorum CM1-VF14]|nr:hypothetical protein [Nostoc desertorum CM1-VF14]
MTHENLQRSLSISTASYVYNLASILAIKTQIKLTAFISSITNFSKATELLLIFLGSFTSQSSIVLEIDVI